ncbi:MAG: hypothetical protein RLZ98_2317 [Pseudomonadota bacterium]|jgi:acyl-CoA synthetase (AMP-forming)/AMP-acid ligase II
MTGNLGDLIRSHRESDKVAVIDLRDPAAPVERTYRDLDRRADAVARGLRNRGIAPGQSVAILAKNRIEFIEVFFGIMRAGCVVVPVNVKLARDTIDFILDDSGTVFHFVETETAGLVPPGRAVVDFDAGYDTFLDFGPFETVPVGEHDICSMPYTSGTTGRPKGVYLGHAGQQWSTHMLVEVRRLTGRERTIVSAPFFHKNALLAIKTAVLPGATLIILPRFDARVTLDAVDRYKATMVTGVPTMMYMLLEERELLSRIDVSSVDTVSMGSAPASLALIERILATFPNCRVQYNYGITEGGPNMTGWYHPEGKPRPPSSVGYPMPGVEFRFEDGPHEQEGELVVRNPGVALGYHNLPEATAERFKDGWFRTGDILRQDDDGWMYFVGRRDDMFVCSGENIFPSEVVIRLERHPGIAQAMILPFDDERRGQVPYAFVKRATGSMITEDEVRKYAIDNGPAYAHPRRVFFVEDFPLSGSNKVDTNALRSLATEE